MRTPLLLLCLLGAGCAPLQLRYLGDAAVDWSAFQDDARYAAWTFGGISGLAYDPDSDSFFALSDGRKAADDDFGPPRWFRLRTALEPDGLRLELLACDTLEVASDADLEGLTRHGDDWTVCAEDPALLVLDRNGRRRAGLPYPKDYHPQRCPDGEVVSGVRENRGFESVTRLPDGTLLTCSEEALAQDGERALPEAGTRVRLLRIRPDGGSFEAWYQTDPMPPEAREGDTVRGNLGVSDMLALDARRVLVLERCWVRENRIRLYEIDLADADAGLDGPPLPKRLVLDLETVRPRLAPDHRGRKRLDNIEALALGPEVDGQRTLFLASDDNFAVYKAVRDGREPASIPQRTLVLAFAIEE